MRAMVDAGAAEWPEFLSGLYRAARKESMAGAEALYTLSQVSATLGNFEGAAGHLAELLERYGDELMGSELPIQLWSLSSRRMAQLQGAGRNLELAAFYRDHYIPRFLRPHVEDTAPLEAVAAALEELGLYGEALEVSREIFAIHTSQGLDEPGALVHLAQLYGLSGRNQECLETLAYTRSLPARDIAPWHGERLLLEGEVLRDLGRMEEAASSWREATGHKTVRQEARSRLALHEASEGQCEAAIPELTGLVALPLEDAPESVLDGRAWLALARCHLSLNQLDEALLAAQEAAGRSDDRLHKRYATYFAYLAAEGQGMTSEALKSDDDLWAALGREDEAHVSFESELENYRKR